MQCEISYQYKIKRPKSVSVSIGTEGLAFITSSGINKTMFVIILVFSVLLGACLTKGEYGLCIITMYDYGQSCFKIIALGLMNQFKTYNFV